MTVLAAIRRLRHGPLKQLAPVWVRLGRFYRWLIRKLSASGTVLQRIGPYGPFKLNAEYAFSDFVNWGSGHNRGFQKCVEACRGKRCAFDIGAHIGLVSMPISRVLAQGGRVYAFEPAEANLRFLRDHVEKNGISNIEIIDALVGDEDTEDVRFYEQLEATGLNSVVARKDPDAFVVKRRRQVTLDSFCDGCVLRPEVIKIDVEGAEMAVLKGAVDTLRRARPVLFLSIHVRELKLLGHSVKDLLDLVGELGYRVCDMDGMPVSEVHASEYLVLPQS